MSERVTWETCPACGRPAAVGWFDGDPVEFDCPRGCSLPTREMTAVFTPRRDLRCNGDWDSG
jgi:hypothetical protein